ncbi:hypothetical protein L4C33_15425 [Vibrio makurazakiensis]|uniref:hypothetical protein n=1 Tax=Vibrio makurazakiensis TaxID=2910250 RepID=UPI003D0C4C94
MRLSTLRIFWITCFSMFTMLTSNIASSESLMMINMLSSAQTMSMSMNCTVMNEDINSETDIEAKQNGHTQTSKMLHHNAADNSMSMMDCGSGPDHSCNCCDAMCMTKIAFAPQVTNSPSLHSHLALITLEPSLSIAGLARSLYRPPIA